jgi:hypothetical protein
LTVRVRLRRLRYARLWVSTQRVNHLPETFGMAQVLEATRIDLLAQPIVHGELLTKNLLALQFIKCAVDASTPCLIAYSTTFV